MVVRVVEWRVVGFQRLDLGIVQPHGSLSEAECMASVRWT